MRCAAMLVFVVLSSVWRESGKAINFRNFRSPLSHTETPTKTSQYGPNAPKKANASTKNGKYVCTALERLDNLGAVNILNLLLRCARVLRTFYSVCMYTVLCECEETLILPSPREG